MNENVRCSKCNNWLPQTAFNKSKDNKQSGLQYWCRHCSNEYVRTRLYRLGLARPMAEVPQCASYLGIHVAERALSKFFDHIERMPLGNPGYDFRCGKGFKIDVKSGCLRPHGRNARWQFSIRRNAVADYFLCIGFNNRVDLEPERVWLIPGRMINTLTHLYITNNIMCIEEWEEYEKSINGVVACCDKLKGVT